MVNKTGMMEVAICNGVIKVNAKTGKVDLKSLERLGMAMAGIEKVGDFGKRLERWMNKEDTKEFMKILMTRKSLIEIEDVHYKEGKRNYKHWGDLSLALKYAMYINKELEVEVIDTFINKKIIDFRILGIDYHKELNKLIDTLEDSRGVGRNKGKYINVSKMINSKSKGAYDKGWDNEKADVEAQTIRSDTQKELQMLIKKGYIKNYEQIKEYFEID